MKPYFIIARSKAAETEYLSSMDGKLQGWRPTPDNAYMFPRAVVAEVERLRLSDMTPGYTTLYSKRN